MHNWAWLGSGYMGPPCLMPGPLKVWVRIVFYFCGVVCVCVLVHVDFVE